MAGSEKKFSTEELFDKAARAIKKESLFFLEDVIAFLPCSKPTFYDYIKVDSNEFNELKEMLDNNRISVKVKMRNKWKDSDTPALQMALMKLICTDEERKKLSMTHIDHNIETKPSFTVFDARKNK